MTDRKPAMEIVDRRRELGFSLKEEDIKPTATAITSSDKAKAIYKKSGSAKEGDNGLSDSRDRRYEYYD